MRERWAKAILPVLLLGLAGCGNHDPETMAQLKSAMTEVKTSAETVLTGEAPKDRSALAIIAQRVAAADRALDRAQDTATALEDAPSLEAAALDYLRAVRGAVDQTRDRYATEIDLAEAARQDSTVSAAIGQAQDAASLERASAEANAKASALAAAVNHAGNAVVERERRLEALMTVLQHNGQSLAGYALVSHDALATAMANNVAPNRAIPLAVSGAGEAAR
jgi:hypothetical protein